MQVIHIKVQVTFVCNEFHPRYISLFCVCCEGKSGREGGVGVGGGEWGCKSD